MTADTLSFLIKVLALSAAVSLGIKAIGQVVSLENWNIAQLSPLALAIVVAPSLIVGAVLAVKALKT